jgi:hypothetical protein
MGGPRDRVEGLEEKKNMFTPDGIQNLYSPGGSIVTVLTEQPVVITDILQKLHGVLNGSAELL